jgi:hypothetical protein
MVPHTAATPARYVSSSRSLSAERSMPNEAPTLRGYISSLRSPAAHGHAPIRHLSSALKTSSGDATPQPGILTDSSSNSNLISFATSSETQPQLDSCGISGTLRKSINDEHRPEMQEILQSMQSWDTQSQFKSIMLLTQGNDDLKTQITAQYSQLLSERFRGGCGF